MDISQRHWRPRKMTPLPMGLSYWSNLMKKCFSKKSRCENFGKWNAFSPVFRFKNLNKDFKWTLKCQIHFKTKLVNVSTLSPLLKMFQIRHFENVPNSKLLEFSGKTNTPFSGILPWINNALIGSWPSNDRKAKLAQRDWLATRSYIKIVTCRVGLPVYDMMISRRV